MVFKVVNKKKYTIIKGFKRLAGSFAVQYTLDVRKPDLRKIVATTDFLVNKFFDLRKIF